MPMKWQKVSIPIAQGVDTKTDEKSVAQDKLINLENGVFTKGGSIVKRNGYSKLGLSTMTVAAASSDISTVRAVHSKGDELIAADNESIHSYVPSEDRWSKIGRFKSVIVNTDVVADSTAKQDMADCATVDNVTVYAWEQDDTGVYISIVNEQTGGVFLPGTLASASGANPRVVGVGSYIHVYYYVSGSMKRILISPSNVRSIVLNGLDASTSEVVSDMHGSVCRYDFEVDGTSVYIAYYTSHGSEKLKVLREKQGGGSLGVQDYTQVADGPITITKEPNTGKICVAWHDTINSLVKAYVLDGTTLQETHEHQIEASVSNVLNITGSFKRDVQARSLLYVLDLEVTETQYAYSGTNVKGDALDIGGDITMEAWIKFESLPTSGNKMTFIARDENATDKKGYYFRFVEGTPDVLGFGCRDSSGGYQSKTVAWDAPTLNTWYHVAVVHDKSAGDVQFYVNGSAQGALLTGLATTTGESSEAQLRIGSENSTHTNYFDGMISEVRIWDTERSGAEIAANYLKEIPSQAGLQGYWRFNNSFDDLSGNGIILTAAGSADYPLPGFVNGYTSTFTNDGNSSAFVGLETETITDNYPCVLFYEIKDSGSVYRQNYVKKAAVTIWADITAAAVFKRHAGIASSSWTDQNDVHVCLVFESTLQTTYFIYMDDGTMIGKMEDGLSGGVVTESVLPGVQDLGGGLYQWVGTYKVRLDTTPGDLTTAATTTTLNAIFTQDGIKRFRMDFQNADAHKMVTSGSSAYINGGHLWKYDSHNIVESGFHVFPEDFTAAQAQNGALKLTADGRYYYRVYATWVNAQGEKERSDCATTIKITLTGSNNQVTLTIPTITHTNKQETSGTGRHLNFEVYRTSAGAVPNAPFYKVTSDDPTASPTTASTANRYVENDPTADNVTFIDEMLDTLLLTKEVDYQDSGELSNLSPPSPSIIAEGQNRIFLAGFQDGSEVRYSKVRYPERTVDFNDALSMTVPEGGGAITGMAVLNEVLIVFKKRRIYAISGEGPNNLGFGMFSQPQIVTTDVGCIAQKSIVTTPDGLMFQSEKGIYVLSQQFQTMYIGAPVEAYNSQTVVSATLAGNKNHVIFLTSSGRTLLYDYFFRQWSTFTNHEGTGGAIWDGVYCYGTTDGNIMQETAGVYLDAGSPIKLRIETAWIKLNTLQGFQRIRRAMILGEFKSKHRLAVDIAYDYESMRRRVVFDAATLVATTTFGDPLGAAFGAGTPFGSGTATSEMESSVYQLKAHAPVQKCQAIKFYFEDLAVVAGVDLAGGYEITELMLEVGVKRGGYKIADTRSI